MGLDQRQLPEELALAQGADAPQVCLLDHGRALHDDEQPRGRIPLGDDHVARRVGLLASGSQHLLQAAPVEHGQQRDVGGALWVHRLLQNATPVCAPMLGGARRRGKQAAGENLCPALAACETGPVSTTPTAAVTFFFSDIQGSTRLLESVGQAYGGILNRHRSILRSAFEERRGIEVGTEGDSFFAVFARAEDAVDAAIAAQRALAQEDWPADASVRCASACIPAVPRAMATTMSGSTCIEPPGYMAAAHGGQIVMSEATRLALGQPPNGMDLRELGQHRLRDLSAPERLYQVSAAGLEAASRPCARSTPFRTTCRHRRQS